MIERIFGVLKRRYRILLLPPEYSLEIQSRLPAGLAAIHNFILTHNPPDGDSSELVDDADQEFRGNGRPYEGENPTVAADGEGDANFGNVEARLMRDEIAQAMWDDYQALLRGRQDLSEDSDDSMSEDIDDL